MILLIFNQELHTSSLIFSLTFSVTSRHILVLQFSVSVALSHPISSILISIPRIDILYVSVFSEKHPQVVAVQKRKQRFTKQIVIRTLCALGWHIVCTWRVFCTLYTLQLIQCHISEALYTCSSVLSLHCGSTHPNRLPKSILAVAFCDFACICLLSSYFQQSQMRAGLMILDAILLIFLK